jgi:hypothetical protein
MRRIHTVRTGLAVYRSTKINGVAIATLLTVVEDKAVLADALFVYHIRNDCVNAIPAKLLLTLVASAISNHHYLATWIVTNARSGRGQ